MPKVIIDIEKCKGCGLCITVCPKEILSYSGKFNTSGYNYVTCIDENKCIACKSCALICPDVVFTILKEEKVKG
ncbi:4Fe-4S dicluster domain-containing protein [Deferribacter autotrophicus]|uniref:4Fe-4S dicluster domain-containing protein n=1 Tax=Deferribacter autotrophicus TaxID=500465 RepID=A0A5A8F4J8_9BACT|nr:4Fe-4S binding protein [Deferribacter autotrophicus]KAA0258015.1 4Fe-4S dicluster domain-containing protein [Deferribacter autotrophicus]